MKVLLIVGLLLVVGFFQLILKGGDASRSGAGGPVGVVLLIAFFAAARAIWKYNPDASKSGDNQQLDKN